MVTSLLQHPETRYFGFILWRFRLNFYASRDGDVYPGFRDDHGGNKTAILPSISAVLDTT